MFHISSIDLVLPMIFNDIIHLWIKVEQQITENFDTNPNGIPSLPKNVRNGIVHEREFYEVMYIVIYTKSIYNITFFR